MFRNISFNEQVDRYRHRCHAWLLSQLMQHRTHFRHGQTVVDIDMLYSAPWHIGVERISGVLHDGNATTALYCQQSGCTVVLQTSEHHTDHPRSVGHGGRAKERINGRAYAILAQATHHMQVALLDE